MSLFVCWHPKKKPATAVVPEIVSPTPSETKSLPTRCPSLVLPVPLSLQPSDFPSLSMVPSSQLVTWSYGWFYFSNSTLGFTVWSIILQWRNRIHIPTSVSAFNSLCLFSYLLVRFLVQKTPIERYSVAAQENRTKSTGIMWLEFPENKRWFLIQTVSFLSQLSIQPSMNHYIIMVLSEKTTIQC